MMLDANFELEKLKRSLSTKGYSDEVMNEVVGYAKEEISAAMSDILSQSLEEAIQEGEQLEADEFLSELRAIHIGSDFLLTTDSGKLDFSEPPFPMLPSLLKNAKVAKDGSRYKVIPIGKKESSKDKNANTTVEAMRALDQAQIDNAQGRQARKHGARTGTRGMMDDAARLAGFYNSHKPSKHTKTKEVGKKGINVEFRTASSKQDPLQQWVKPGKHKDMTPAIRRINAEMQNKMSLAVAEIIQKYEEMY